MLDIATIIEPVSLNSLHELKIVAVVLNVHKNFAPLIVFGNYVKD